MRGILLLITLILPFTSHSQSDTEDIVKLLNVVRTNPQNFLAEYVNPYIEKNNLRKNKYAKSLVAELKEAKKSGALQLSPVISKIAEGHAMDMGKKSKTGHVSSNGTTFEKRLREKIKFGLIGENCSYGYATPLDIVLTLLIDDGIKSLGHRKNILNPKFHWVGIAIEPHRKFRVNCVMDFAEEL
jgi:uncharacterized protein YkwD